MSVGADLTDNVGAALPRSAVSARMVRARPTRGDNSLQLEADPADSEPEGIAVQPLSPQEEDTLQTLPLEEGSGEADDDTSESAVSPAGRLAKGNRGRELIKQRMTRKGKSSVAL